jgi:hypothetical protein
MLGDEIATAQNLFLLRSSLDAAVKPALAKKRRPKGKTKRASSQCKRKGDYTPLMHAIADGETQLAKALIATQGTSIHARTGRGYTALIIGALLIHLPHVCM